MNEFPVSVRAIGAGSQPLEKDESHYLAMPHEISTFAMPVVPAHAGRAPLTEARDVLASMLRALERWDSSAAAYGPRVDLTAVGADTLSIINQMLVEGEVSIKLDGAPSHVIQESVFTGLWRIVAHGTDAAIVGDWIEAAAIPRVVAETARGAAAGLVREVAFPPGTMNSPALLREIAARMRERRPNGAAHVINLTLFPMTPEDHQVLERALPVGPVAIMSRGFGNCRITSTGARDVWRVQYFNSMSTLILDTIEVVDMPEVALAAAEDLADTRTRLAELVDWMGEPSAT